MARAVLDIVQAMPETHPEHAELDGQVAVPCGGNGRIRKMADRKKPGRKRS